MCKIIFRIIHARDQIAKLFIFSLKNVSLSGIGAHEDTKCSNSIAVLEKGKYLEKFS